MHKALRTTAFKLLVLIILIQRESYIPDATMWMLSAKLYSSIFYHFRVGNTSTKTPRRRQFSCNIQRIRNICAYGLYGAYNYYGLVLHASRIIHQCQSVRCMSCSYSTAIHLSSVFVFSMPVGAERSSVIGTWKSRVVCCTSPPNWNVGPAKAMDN